MRQILINRNLYQLPLGELYADRFKRFSQNGVIVYDFFNYLDTIEQCQTKKQFFDCIAKALTVFDDTDNTYEALKEMLSQTWQVDDMIKYYIQEKKYDLAIKRIDNSILKMVELSDAMLSQRKTI